MMGCARCVGEKRAKTLLSRVRGGAAAGFDGDVELVVAWIGETEKDAALIVQ
jgi:hypothetical protein